MYKVYLKDGYWYIARKEKKYLLFIPYYVWKDFTTEVMYANNIWDCGVEESAIYWCTEEEAAKYLDEFLAGANQKVVSYTILAS